MSSIEGEPKIELDPNAVGDEMALQQFDLRVEELLAAEKEQPETPQRERREEPLPHPPPPEQQEDKGDKPHYHPEDIGRGNQVA